MPGLDEGQHLTTPPSLSDGAVAPVQLDAAGALKVAGAVTGNVTTTTPTTTALNGAADMTVTTTAAALPALAAGPKGILVRSHPDNDMTSRIRVASNAAANIGVPLAPGESYTFESIDNANHLKAILEASVSGATLLEVEQA